MTIPGKYQVPRTGT